MLPGEADAAQHLDAVLRVVHRVVQRQRGGRRGRQRVLGGRLVGGTGGAPGQGGGTFGPAGHGGAQVLDRLELTDRAAELPAGPGVVGGRAAAPGGHPGGFGREQGRRQVADAFCAQTGQEVLRRDDRIGEPDGGQLAGEVERGEPVDGHARLARLEQEPHVAVGAVAGEGGRGEQVACGPQDRAGLARHPQPAVRLAGPGQRAGSSRVERDAGGGLGLCESRPEFLPAAAGEQEASQRGRQHRARGQGPGQLLERGGQVGHRAAVQGDGEDAEGGQVVEECGAGPLAGDGYRGGAFGPVAEGCLQGLLLLRHRDRHDCPPVLIVRIRTRSTCRRPGCVSNRSRCAW